MQPSIYDSLRDAAAAAESLSSMLLKERTTYRSRDYLRDCQDPTNSLIVVTESDRRRLVDWCYGVVDHCDFDREVVAIAMDLVDRFLSSSCIVSQKALQDRRQFQLVVIAALYIAIKVHETQFISSAFFAGASRGFCTAEEIEAMELIVLHGLEWRICGPTSAPIARDVLSLLRPRVFIQDSTWAFVLDEVNYQCEFAVSDYFLSTQRKSTVALAAIFNALDRVDKQDRQAMYSALLSVVNEEFDSPANLLAARNRLVLLLKGNNAVEAERGAVVSDDSDAGSLDEEAGCYMDQ